MRICLVHEEYPEETNFGGIATYQKNVAEELVKQGHQVYVICRSLTQDKTYQENGVNIFRIYVSHPNSVKFYIEYRQKVATILRKLQANNQIDLIETPDWGAETIFFEKDRQVPLVVRLHTPLKIWLKYNKNNFGKIKNKMLNWEKTMLKKADLVTCCSNALKNKIETNFKFLKDKIIVTPNPANLKMFYPNKNILKEDKIIYVGSLEQRKGVCILAQALNIIFKEYPNLKVQFIGKDTKRNYKNICTIKLIQEIVATKYQANLEFIGQIPNYELNDYLNSALVGVFPSLFDNFPYVVLEAMASGLQIVGSKNSGMVEMLDDPRVIYETGNYKDLAKKILAQYHLAIKENYNYRNIKRVNELYNPKNVCYNLIELYQRTIINYAKKEVLLNDFQNVIKDYIKEPIIKIQPEKSGLANLVYRLYTKSNIYILKKYKYQYNFDLIDKLYNIYEKNNIAFIRPINSQPISYKYTYYNIFPYYKKDKKRIIDLDYLQKIINAQRQVNLEDAIVNKCDYYYNNINIDNINKEDIQYVKEIFKNLNKEELKGNYLNHGDIQKSNILTSNKKNYLIDFDEVNVGHYLYDYAVIIIKMGTRNNKIDYVMLNNLKELIKKDNMTFNDLDFYNIIILYLCKILLEKYYLHSIKKINLFSKKQQKDSYQKYLKFLKEIENYRGEYE